MGFPTGQEVDWLPRATSVLLTSCSVSKSGASSDHSITLADDLERGKLDIAFLRREQKLDSRIQSGGNGAASRISAECIIRFVRAQGAIDPHDSVGETFIGISEIARVLRAVVSDYLKRTGN